MIVHIISAGDWSRARIAGRVTAPSLQSEGYLHCSDPGTVHLPADNLYAIRTNLVLLQIDPARLGSVELRWEPGVAEDPAGPWFPHVYGPIPVEAVKAVHPFRPNTGGRFSPVQPDR